MRYGIGAQLTQLAQGEAFGKGEAGVEILTPQEFQREYGQDPAGALLLSSCHNIQYCKAEVTDTAFVGTLLLLGRESPLSAPQGLGYSLTRDRLILVDESAAAQKLVECLGEYHSLRKNTPAQIFFELLQYLIKDDVAYLQKQQQKLADLEDSLPEEDDREFQRRLHLYRKSFLGLSFHYSQLTDLADTLGENFNRILSEKDARLFSLFSARASRLEDHVSSLREYALQLQDMYQNKQAARQNKVMQFFTVVTTLFLPLTLLTGWYGMNFSHMPELSHPLAYPSLAILCVLVVILEILYFRKKKWL